MDAPERGAFMLARLIAVALIGWTTVDLASDWLVYQQKQLPIKTFPGLGKSLPLALGLILMVKSIAAAQWISEKLDE